MKKWLAMKPTTRIVHVSFTDALSRGPPPADNLAVPIFSHGSLVVELYTPVGQGKADSGEGSVGGAFCLGVRHCLVEDSEQTAVDFSITSKGNHERHHS